MYADLNFYKTVYVGTITDDTVINRLLRKTAFFIDTLTYNRIEKIGFENCSNYEKEIIKEVNCQLVDFYFENEKDLKTIINSYSLNGVSITYGEDNNNIITINGITLLNSTYTLLKSTRFTCLGL